MYTSKQYLETIIRSKQRRLHKLKEKEAMSGIDTSPSILIEIENLEKEMKDLEHQIEDITRKKAESLEDDELEVSFLENFPYYDLSTDLRDKYQELERILVGIKTKERKAYELGEALEHQSEYGDDEKAELDQEQLEALTKSIHILILYALEKVLEAPALLADYKHGFEQFKDNLSQITMAPYIGVTYPVVLDYMSPYIELISNLVLPEPQMRRPTECKKSLPQESNNL